MGFDVKRVKRWITTRWNWYIRGYYHCDKCPYCWSEYSYEGDGDCGCYIRGELWDTCRLIPPFRFLIGWPRKRAFEYHELHAYDGYDCYWDQMILQETAFEESIKILLRAKEVYYRDYSGRLIPVCKDELRSISGSAFYDAIQHYEDEVHPVVPKPKLIERWKVLIRDTWKQAVYERIAPYLPRKKRRKKK